MSSSCDSSSPLIHLNKSTFDVNGEIDLVQKNVLLFNVLFLFITTTACFIYFLIEKKKYARTNIRVTTFIFFYYLGVTLFSLAMPLVLVVGISKYPCWLTYTLASLSLGCFTTTNFTRSTTYLLMTHLSYSTYKFGRISINETYEAEQGRKSSSILFNFFGHFMDIFYGLKFIFSPNSIQKQLTKEVHLRTLVTLRFISSRSGSLFFCFVILAPFVITVLIVNLVTPTFYEGCTGCAPENLATFYTIVGFGGILMFNAIFFAIKTKNFPDAWGVFQENRLSAVGVSLGYFGGLVVFVSTIEFRYYFYTITSFGYAFGFFVVTACQIFIAKKKEGNWKSRVLSAVNSTRNSENKNSIAPASTIISSNFLGELSKTFPQLNHIISVPELRRGFELHLSTEFAVENLCFLEDSFEWKSSYNDVAPSASVSRARKIVNSYISDRGLYQINIPGTIAKELLEIFKDEQNLPAIVDITMFDSCRYEIATLLEKGAVARFLKTPEYLSYESTGAIVSSLL